MREVPKSGPLVLRGGSADPPDPALATGLCVAKHCNKVETVLFPSEH